MDWFTIRTTLASIIALCLLILGPVCFVAGLMHGEAWSGALGTLAWPVIWIGLLAWSHG